VGDPEAFEFAGPALRRGFGDPCGQAVADEEQAGPLGGVGAGQGASFAGHLVDAACPVGAAAVAAGGLAAFEVAGEFLPSGFGGRAVFLCGAQLAAAREERPVTGDDLLRVDRVAAHGGVEVLVAQDRLADVRRQAVLQRLGGEDPSHVAGSEGKRAAGAGGEAGRHRGVLDAPVYVVAAEWPVLRAGAALGQRRRRRVPHALERIAGRDRGDGAGALAADPRDDDGQDLAEPGRDDQHALDAGRRRRDVQERDRPAPGSWQRTRR
jgi:hypothetical protein